MRYVACLLLAAATAALAAPEANPWPRKKIIETGWDEASTERLRQNLAVMEQTPFDGAVVGAVGKRDDGKGVSLRGAFAPDAWKAEWFAGCLADLQAIKPTRLTDNFLILGANPGNVDWFDDAGWKNVVEHWRIAARLAKQGGLKGLLFDPEPYTEGLAQFRYLNQADRAKHTFPEYYAKARQRGREVMAAVAAEYPACTLFCYFMNSVNFPAAGQRNPVQALAGSGYGLYPAFIDGWLDVAPPTLTFVDGCESSYLWNSTSQFLQGAVLMKGDCQSLVSPENRAKYRAQVQVSFGLYLDAYRNPEGSHYFIDGLGGPRVNRLRQNCADALKAADEYVWVYGEQCRWWPTPNTSLKQSWDEGLPGCSAALSLAVDPVAYARKRIQELWQAAKLVEYTRNGDFAADKTTDTTGAAVAWKEGGPPAGWGTWQTDDSKGTFTWDRATGNKASGSAKVAGVRNGCVIQGIKPVQPGESYVVAGTYRVQGQGTAWLRVRWQKPDGGWTAEQLDKLIYPSAKPGEWGELFGVAEVPEGVGQLLILLCVDGQTSPEDVIWFDDVHCHKVD